MKFKVAKMLIPCLCSLMVLSGCGKEDEHVHTFSKEWLSNSEEHWHASTCGHKVVDSRGPHVDADINGKCDICNRTLSVKPDPVPSSYYDGYDLELEGGELEHELQRLCFETHTTFVKYSQVNAYFSFTSDHISAEAAPSGVAGKKNEWFYTGKISTGYGTKEHVWPCANSAGLWVHDEGGGEHYVDGSKYAGGGSDLYHIRTANSTVNTARGNSKFVDFDDDELEGKRSGVVEVGETGGKYNLKIQGYETTKTGGYQYAQLAEVADEYKGDIARILVYIWVHYTYRGNYYGHESMLGSLDLKNVMGYGSDDFRTQEVLCEWNELDPPSETEKLRNNTVQKIQGNRNPFVDYPELMNSLFLM